MKAKRFVFAVALALATSCAGNDSFRDRMLERIAAHTEAMRAETLIHGARVADMASPEAIPSEELRHHDHIDEHMGPMHESIDHMGMSSCHEEAGDMHHWMEDLEVECERHRDAMLATGDMGQLHDEELRHQSWMDAMLEAMDAMHHQMEEGCAQHGMMGD